MKCNYVSTVYFNFHYLWVGLFSVINQMPLSIKLTGWIVFAWFVQDSWVVRVSNSMPKVPGWNHRLGFFTLSFINDSAYGLFNNLNTFIKSMKLVHWTVLNQCWKTFYFISNKLLTLQLSLILKQYTKENSRMQPHLFRTHTSIIWDSNIFEGFVCRKKIILLNKEETEEFLKNQFLAL